MQKHKDAKIQICKNTNMQKHKYAKKILHKKYYKIENGKALVLGKVLIISLSGKHKNTNMQKHKYEKHKYAKTQKNTNMQKNITNRKWESAGAWQSFNNFLEWNHFTLLLRQSTVCQTLQKWDEF